ncbi:MAG: DUF1934 domain-containing protein [Hungatella sp.]|nr:DUF1934 domain-containing protein [Hungatella sp.]
MTRDVLIRIGGARDSGSDQEEVEMITTGDYFLKDGKHYIIYEEIEEDSKQITKNTIKVAPDTLDIIKRGNTNTHMIFQKNKKNISCYMTPFGELVVGIHTHEVHVEEEKDALKVDIRYALDINYEHVSNCNITVQVKSRNME